MIPILAIIGTFGSIIILVYMFFSSRNKERMALIEHGKDAGIFKAAQSQIESLKFGIVAVMIGIGLLIGHLLEKAGLPEFVAYFSMILILGGAGLTGFYYLQKNRDHSEL